LIAPDKKRNRLLHYAWIVLLLFPGWLQAQEGFDQTPSFDQIQDILREGISKHDQRQQALAWYYWAQFAYRRNVDSDSAFQYLARSVERFHRTPDTFAYQHARMDQADWLAKRGLLDEALQMQTEALSYFNRTKNLRMETMLLLQISRNYTANHDTTHGREFRTRFLVKNDVLKDTLLQLSDLLDEVNRFQYTRRYQDALKLSKRTLDLAKQSGNNRYLTWAQFNIGAMSVIEHDYHTGLRFLRDAERSNQSDEAIRRSTYHYMALAYAALDSLPFAYKYAIRFGELTDSTLSGDRSATIQRLALQFDARQKFQAIKNLEQANAVVQSKVQQQTLLAASLAVGLAALLLAMFFIIRDYRHRLHTSRVISSQKEEINAQKIRELEDQYKIETMQSMLAGQESERQRIAHDLHDSLGGLLAAAKLQVENLPGKFPELARDKDVLKIKSLLDDTVAETRQIARNLQPHSLVQFGLVNALQDLIGRVGSKGAPSITFQCFGEVSGLSQDVALNCYRVVQELLQNSLKHAKANEILVQITRAGNELAILVEDDGIGFDPKTIQKGMGTGSVAQRVQFMKGDLSIQTAPGQGTSTLFTIPL
jgi:signal transduction histidine kinase